MMEHPWMHIELDETSLINAKYKLNKYVSIRN